MSVVARLEPLATTKEERRRAPRLQLTLGAAVGPSGSSALIHDISTTGLLFETAAALPDELVEVQLPRIGPAQARVVWRLGHFFGCEFAKAIPASAVSAALLQSDPRARPGLATQFPQLSAQAGEFAQSPPRRGRSTLLKAFVAAALVLAGAAYLVASGHLVLLAVIAVVIGGLAALLTAVAMFGLDNEIRL